MYIGHKPVSLSDNYELCSPCFFGGHLTVLVHCTANVATGKNPPPKKVIFCFQAGGEKKKNMVGRTGHSVYLHFKTIFFHDDLYRQYAAVKGARTY